MWDLLGAPRPPDADSEDEVPDWFLDLLGGLRRQAAREVKAVWEGFATACREARGLELETALGASRNGISWSAWRSIGSGSTAWSPTRRRRRRTGSWDEGCGVASPSGMPTERFRRRLGRQWVTDERRPAPWSDHG